MCPPATVVSLQKHTKHNQSTSACDSHWDKITWWIEGTTSSRKCVPQVSICWGNKAITLLQAKCTVQENWAYESKSPQSTPSTSFTTQLPAKQLPSTVISWHWWYCWSPSQHPGSLRASTFLRLRMMLEDWGGESGTCRSQWLCLHLPAPASNSATLWTMPLFSIEPNFPFLFPSEWADQRLLPGSLYQKRSLGQLSEILPRKSYCNNGGLIRSHIVYHMSMNGDSCVLSCWEPI